jgi:hypothetical protein
MLWTGLGLSLSTATYLRWVLLSLSAVALLFLILKRFSRIGTSFKQSDKETKPCHTK